MDNTSTGSRLKRGTSSSIRDPTIPSSSSPTRSSHTGDSRSPTPSTSASTPKTHHRIPLYPGRHPRSVSLPQALHSLSLSSRPNVLKTGRKISGVHATQKEATNSRVCPTSQLVSSAGSAETRLQPLNEAGNDDSFSPIGASQVSNYSPKTTSKQGTSPSSKRAISEGHSGSSLYQGPSVVRSQTTSRLAEILNSGDTHFLLDSGETQLLDPLPDTWLTQDGTDMSMSFDLSIASEAPAKRLHHTVDGLVSSDFGSFHEAYGGESYLSATDRALSNPDILRCIFSALDSMTIIPHELVQPRRKPLSLSHAQLIFGDNKRAVEAWEQSQPVTSADSPGAGLFNCLLVNSTWHEVAAKVLQDRIHFRTNERWIQFARRGVSALSRKPRMLVLHKLLEATQVEFDLVEKAGLGENLEWLEFYTCVGLEPPTSLLGAQLTTLILPGCYRVNDRTLINIAGRCPRLEHLDIRACDQVSDRGIKIIAKYCPMLQLLNVGRTRGGDLVTYKGIKHLARRTQIKTLGIAGCHIDDRAIWELALNRGPNLQRLSLNNCRLLTDASIPRVLGYMPNLTVLEIRGCIQITHMRPIALFKLYREKQGQPPLIEGCEVIERRLQLALMRLQRESSMRVMQDLSTWANGEEA